MKRLAICALAIVAFAAAAQAQQASPDTRAQAMALYRVCHADVAKLCAGVTPGGGRILACLKNHAPDVSQDCKAGPLKAKAERDKAAGAGVSPN